MRDRDRADLIVVVFGKNRDTKALLLGRYYSREDGGRVNYHMIHATDHDAAPLVIARAYRKALTPKEGAVQLDFGFATPPKGVRSE